MRGLIAIVVIGVIVGAVLVLSPAGPTKATGGSGTPGQPVASGNGTVLLPEKIVLECEEPTTMDAKTKDGKTEVLHIRDMQEGQLVRYLEVDNGFIDRCNLGADKAEPAKLPGRASYEFDVKRKDTYYVYLRAKWRDNCGNSAWVKIDDSAWFNLEDEEGQLGEKNYKWAWHPLWVAGAPKGFELTPGKHTLWFNVREDGPKLDQWLISTEAQKPSGEYPVKK